MTEAQEEAIGTVLAKELNLRDSGQNWGQYFLGDADATPLGVYRKVKRILEEEEAKHLEFNQAEAARSRGFDLGDTVTWTGFDGSSQRGEVVRIDGGVSYMQLYNANGSSAVGVDCIGNHRIKKVSGSISHDHYRT